MAQETSGTISKTILKNEMLPLLVNEQRRADRAYALEEQAKRRAAELAAKKAAEEAKYVPKFDAATGADMWEHVIKPQDEKDVQAGLELAKDQSVPRQQVNTYVNEMNRQRIQRAETSKQLKESLLKTAEDLSKKYLKTTRDYVHNWAKTKSQLTGPEVFSAEALNNPDLIDFDAIGKKGKEYKLQQYTFRDKNGNTKTIAVSPLFEYQKQYDPVLGADVPVVTGVNGVEAKNLIESDPDMQNAFQVWSSNRAKQYQTDRTFYDPATGSPMMIRPDLAEEQAAKEFVQNAFGKYGTIKYGQQAQLPRKGGAGGGASEQFTMSIATPAGVGSHEFNIESLGYSVNPKTKKSVFTPQPQTQTGDVGGKNDVTYSYEKEYVHPANKKVRLLQNYDEGKLAEYIIPQSGGGYLLKTGFNYANPTKRTLYFADKDLYFGGNEKGPYYKNGVRQNWTRIKKGDEIPPATAEVLIAQSKKEKKPSGVTKETGYEITANMYTGEEGDVAKRPSVKMFIPESSAGEIKKHIEMEQQKKRRKRGPETTVDEIQGGEVDLGY